MRIASHLSKNIIVTAPEQIESNKKASNLARISTAVVDVDYAIADSATLVISFDKINSTLPLFLPDCVIALVRNKQLIANHFELFKKIKADWAKNMLLITGPSRTADIEKLLILGAHGPRRLVVIFIDEK
jgi:L-lactate dehydrogenase complex protein LldG